MIEVPIFKSQAKHNLILNQFSFSFMAVNVRS